MQEGANNPEMASRQQQGSWRKRRHLLPPYAWPWLAPRALGAEFTQLPWFSHPFPDTLGAAQLWDHPPPVSPTGRPA